MLLFFDPNNPGTTRETLDVLTGALADMDYKLLIVLNKVCAFVFCLVFLLVCVSLLSRLCGPVYLWRSWKDGIMPLGMQFFLFSDYLCLVLSFVIFRVGGSIPAAARFCTRLRLAVLELG